MGRDSKPVHEHHLKLVGERRKGSRTLKCGACTLEISGGDIYYWCNLCKSHLHETCAKLPIQVKHFFHLCTLFLHMSPAFVCNCCLDLCYHLTYHCERCEFDMCLSCTTNVLSIAATSDGENEAERILHCCHRHPLRPLPSESNSLLPCRVCNLACSLGVGGPTWGCEPCNFHLHKSCLDLLPEMVEKKSRSKLASGVLKTTRRKTCTDCGEVISSTLVFHTGSGWRTEFLCISCLLVRRLVDESSSSQVSKVINHFFHPCPDLNLILSPSATCNACFKSHHHFSYHCKSCVFFFLCVDCAQLPQSLSHENESNQLVRHFSHWHPLKLFTSTQNTYHICSLCEKLCSEPFYNCNDQCHFSVHQSCMRSLPHKINHRLLNKTIVLLHIPFFECTTCNRQCSGLTFYCNEFNYTFCVKCVLWPKNVFGNAGRFTSFRHWHQLSLCETTKEQKASCFLCEECCIGGSYKCTECAFFFHKSCAELPTQLDHPIHPQHSLTLTNRSSEYPDVDMTCKLCLQNLSQNSPLFDWVYRCHQCDFQLDIQCSSCLPSLEYTGHPHLLYVVVNMHGERKCHACGKSCKGSSTLHCAVQECNFSLHLHCGPLPRTIKHACHVHPLTLQDYYVEDNASDEFACHVCEEKRDPRLPVYYCSQGCFMLCDLKCASSEIFPMLRGENGEVELLTPFPRVECRVINSKMMLVSSSERGGAEDEVQKNKYVFSLKELSDSCFDNEGFEEEETFGLKMLFEEEEQEQQQQQEEMRDERLKSEDEKDDGAEMSSISDKPSPYDAEVESYSFSWNALSRFSNTLYIPSRYDLEGDFLKEYDGSTMTGTFALPETLGPIYQEFFGIYNIIDDKCVNSYAKKRVQVFVICVVLHKMRMTKVVDVNKRDILQWLGWIKSMGFGGFNVGFVAENIKQVWRAHYYIRSKKIVDAQSLELQELVEEKTKTVEALRTKLAEEEARLQEFQQMEKDHDTYRVVGSRGPMKRERTEALQIKWRTCYESLVVLPGNAPPK